MSIASTRRGVKGIGRLGVSVVVVPAETMRDDASFTSFVEAHGGRVRRALVAFYGVQIGTEVAAEAMATAWERWPEISQMDNPAGYLFRVGQSRSRRHLRWARRTSLPLVADRSVVAESHVDLLRELDRLKPMQRAAVVLVKSYGFSYREVAQVLGVSEAAVTNHVHRGLAALRSKLKETS